MNKIFPKLFSKQTKPIPETECFICLEKCDQKYSEWKKRCKCKVYCCDPCKKEYKKNKEFSCPICRKKRIKNPEVVVVIETNHDGPSAENLPTNEEMLREIYRIRQNRESDIIQNRHNDYNEENNEENYDDYDYDEEGCCLSCIDCITDREFCKKLSQILLIFGVIIFILFVPEF